MANALRLALLFAVFVMAGCAHHEQIRQEVWTTHFSSRGDQIVIPLPVPRSTAHALPDSEYVAVLIDQVVVDGIEIRPSTVRYVEESDQGSFVQGDAARHIYVLKSDSVLSEKHEWILRSQGVGTTAQAFNIPRRSRQIEICYRVRSKQGNCTQKAIVRLSNLHSRDFE